MRWNIDVYSNGEVTRFEFYGEEQFIGEVAVRERDYSPLIEDMRVEPKLQGMGRGSDMLDRISRVYSRDYDQIAVHSFHSTVPFYAGNGFELVEREPPMYVLVRELENVYDSARNRLRKQTGDVVTQK